nr:class I SAM-dependent methyltransferase [Desulfobacterales bacterium]
MKIQSSLIDSEEQQDLKSKYEEIYTRSDVWMYKKSHGIHSVVLKQIIELLPGARVLDAGCGAGRLSLMIATQADWVDGFDFSEAAIHIANLNAKACRIDNVSFFIADLDNYQSQNPGNYDLITLIGVLEHVKDPIISLRAINRLLKEGGTVVVSCPNFLNFRGYTYMTLLTLFDLPMSLADLRQVNYMDMQHWSKETGFEPYKSIGAIYRFGWVEKAVEDMIKRVPLAVRDKELSISINYEDYNSWLYSQLDFNRQYLSYLEVRGILKRIQRIAKLDPKPLEDIDPGLWTKMSQYLNEDIDTDPFYCETEPFCYQGGECIYLLRKVKDVI